MNCLQIYFVFSLSFSVATCANFFVYFGSPFGSHRIAIWPLVEELLNRGHKVTFFQTLSLPSHDNPEGLTEIVIQDTKETLLPPPDYLAWRLAYGQWVNLLIRSDTYRDYGVAACETFLASKEGQEVISWGQFDVVILDDLSSECGYAFAHVWNAKTIVFATVAPIGGSIEFMGIPDDSATFADVRFPFLGPAYFVQRVLNELRLLNNYVYRKWIYYPELEGIIRRHMGERFGQETRLADLAAQTSLRLTNNHYSIEGVRNSLPFSVSIGGAHLDVKRKPDHIPKALTDFLGLGDFIYVSFGTLVEFSNISLNLKTVFFEAFENSGVNVILKYEGIRPSTLSSKIFTATWLPQQEILSSPNCKGFICHGGIKSILEAIKNGVPMILMPICCDQDYNAFNQKRLGRAQVLELSTLSKEGLAQAIHKLLHNAEYKRKTMEAAQQFFDRPIKPLDEAVYWTEYVTRHKDTVHLKSEAHTLYWFQRRLLDVWLFLLTNLLIVAWCLRFICIQIIRYANTKRYPKLKQTKNKKKKNK